MELHARLVHAEAGLRVVEVRASNGEQSLGSALAEAATAQAAEDLAVGRLLQRLEQQGRAEAALHAGANAVESHSAVPFPPSRPAAEPLDPFAAASRSAATRAEAAEQGPDPSGKANRPPARSADRGIPSPPAAQTELLQPGLAAAPGTASQPAVDSAAVTPEPAAARAGSHPVPAPGPGDPGMSPIAAASSDSDSAQAAEQQPWPNPAVPRQKPSPGLRAPQHSRPDPEEHDVAPPSDPQEEPPPDPEDWSQELTALDLQLRRLGWGREQESTYLQRAFGHPSRSRLTRYSDLRAYLLALEGLESGSDPVVAAVPLRRSELLAQGDALLAQLGWSADQGRALLERELNRVSRQQLSDVQLLQFNMLLEGELLAGGAAI